MFPKVPEDLSALSQDALKALRTDIKNKARELRASGAEVDKADALAAADGVTRIDERLATLAQEEAEAEAAAAALAALSDEDPEDPEDPDPEVVEDPDDPETPEVEDKELAEVTASKGTIVLPPKAKRPQGFGLAADPAAAAAARAAQAAPVGTVDVIEATGAGGYEGQFEDWKQFADALADVAGTLSAGSDRRSVGVIRGRWDEAHTLTEDTLANVQKVGTMKSFAQDADPEIKAAFCAPATPYYNLGCRNTDRRPVFGSMPTFAAPRNAVSIYPSPTLEDITTGYGIWDRDDDADPEAVKAACQTIDCADSDTYYLYGVYRCLTVKNLLQMSFPELVEAYLNRLAAAQARLAENQLLNAMGARATAVATPPLDYDGPVSVLSTLLHTMALHAEHQRWDLDGNMHAWIPRWVREAFKISLMRRRVTNGQGVRIPSNAEIDGLFRSAGYNVTWFLDRPTWAATIPAVQAAGSLRNLPTTVDVLVAPEGKFAVMDRGELRIGVAPGNLYRDNTSNSRNEFTFFFESFEGLVDTDSCPAYLLEIPACWNGVQVADIAAPECDGTTIGS